MVRTIGDVPKGWTEAANSRNVHDFLPFCRNHGVPLIGCWQNAGRSTTHAPGWANVLYVEWRHMAVVDSRQDPDGSIFIRRLARYCAAHADEAEDMIRSLATVCRLAGEQAANDALDAYELDAWLNAKIFIDPASPASSTPASRRAATGRRRSTRRRRAPLDL